ncbi:HAAS signaling domain-containing protein [Candidatus Xianfuyuplasma coldseepsis]|uniref:Uncharacterized protein n=1 Tax=Candidatus Xianfuyuplasma coldseepsis TaxID=2782163 RepID=A0A7L7KP49_9MOLU|nr:hypothetical protein [Xianfuyuplasma coldseepsis]QMS84551.1 hypothetical protein G4Z02_01905 [Xianfuyuplasma coldseepsis]
MDLLERYLYQIKRYLPLKEREETINELRSLLLDQLDQSDNPDKDDALRSIIIEFGEPRDVASRYNERGPIISKQMEPIMMLVMKIVSITLPLVLLFADSLAFVMEEPDFSAMDFLLNLAYMIPNALYALMISIGMIFIIFALIERYLQPKFDIEEHTFKPELLPKLPAKVFKMSYFESIFTILILVAMLYIINLRPGLIGIYFDGQVRPLFNNNFDKLVPLLNVGWFATILLHIYYLYAQRKNLTTKTLELILAVYGAIIFIILATSNVFNSVIIDGFELDFLPTLFKYIFLFIAVASIIGNAVEYIKMFINLEDLDEVQKK